MDAEASFCAIKRTMEPSIPCVGSDDEESFVVLGTSSFNEEELDGPLSDEILPPIRSGKVHDMQNLIKMEISQINNSTILPEMPSAADTLNAVTTSVANITLSPDSSYEEIQKQVEELIKENEKLKNIIAQNNLSMKAQYDRILAWKDDVNKVMKSYKDKFVEAKNYIDKCKEENSKLANDVEKYKKIKELQDEEIINLKSKEKEIPNAEPVWSSAEQNMVEFELQVSKKKVEDLQTALAEANIKNAELIAENENLLQKVNSLPNVDEELQSKDQEIRKLQLECKGSNEQICKLRSEIDNLKEALGSEKQKSTDFSVLNMSLNENKLKSYEVKINQLTQENCSLKEEVTSLKYSLSARAALEEKYGQLREQLTQTQKTVLALEVENKNKIQEIEELRKLFQNNSKSDEIYALNEQLTLYKNDFEAERESKNAIKQERDQIAEDLKNLQKRNKQLQNEIEAIRARTEQPPKADGFVCPKCAFAFNNYQSLENHVHRCLDLEGFP